MKNKLRFLDTLNRDIASDFEMLRFLKREVGRLTEDNIRLERKIQIAYSYGYEDHYKGLSFDTKFSIDDLDVG